MKIIIETIPHREQRYNTVADWYYDEDGTLRIKISETGDDRMNRSLGLHEYIEEGLCKARGITQKQVDDFDMSFQKINPSEEPGDQPSAPYHKEHVFATAHEISFLKEQGVDPKEYDRKLDEIYEGGVS